MIKLIKQNIFLLLAIVVAIYIVSCDILMTFSISMNVVFFSAVTLFVMIHYITNHKINDEERDPSFFYEFTKVFSIFFFLGIFSLIIFNIVYPKNYIDTVDQNYDYIIVFGAGTSEGKTEIINSRIDKAVEYSKIYPRCKFVLTGAKGGNELIEEALYMRNYMAERGVDDKKILIDVRSINTYENIVNSLELIKQDVIRRNARENIITRPFRSDRKDYFDLDFLNIGLMSSDFHLTRINMMAKKVGIHKPYDILCETKNLYKPYLYVREDLSLFKALVLNQIKF